MNSSAPTRKEESLHAHDTHPDATSDTRRDSLRLQTQMDLHVRGNPGSRFSGTDVIMDVRASVSHTVPFYEGNPLYLMKFYHVGSSFF